MISDIKERLVRVSERLEGRIKRKRRDAFIRKMRKKLKSTGVSIISQNCIGGVFYHDMQMEFLSPMINLFFKEPDFVRLVLNLHHYMESDLSVEMGNEYPIGWLDDVEIHFMHYKTCQEAKDSWDRRKKRINYDKIIVVATDRNGFSEEVFEDWKKIPFPKVLFTVNEKYSKEMGTVEFPKYSSEKYVPDLIPNREFYKDNVLISIVNEIEK